MRGFFLPDPKMVKDKKAFDKRRKQNGMFGGMNLPDLPWPSLAFLGLL